MKIYGSEPVEIASDVIVDNSEMYFYQYLPVKMAYDTYWSGNLPPQLERLKGMITCIVDDFNINVLKGCPNDDFYQYYMYVTAKCLYVPKGENLNRMGWHCDGFMTDDINYIWCDSIPTEYVTGEFKLVQDHVKSIEQMYKMLYYKDPFKCKVNSIYRLDETVIHRCDFNRSDNAVLRHFVKVSFSKEKYNLRGNSHNYLLDYNWEMKNRDADRNHPVK